METDKLIDQLSRDLAPAPAGKAARRIAGAAALGLVLTLAVLLVLFGLRPDLAEAVLGMMFWMKATYAALLALAGFWCADRLARPAGSARGGLRLALAALAILVVIAVVKLMIAPPADRMAIWLGGTWRTCPRNLLLLAAPVLALTLLAMRRLAPTRLALAGGAAGLFAGGLAALVYSLHCPETAPAFVATWYTLGVALSAGLGAMLGPLVLRWR